MTSFEIGPPGLRGVGAFLLTWLFVSSMVIPFAVLGLVAAIAWRDWDPLLRVACGVGGLATAVGIILPMVWAVLRGCFWRERIQISPGGVVVFAGLPWRPSQRAASGPALSLEVAKVTSLPLRTRIVGGQSLRLAAGAAIEMVVGAGLPIAAQAELRRALAEARADTPADPNTEPRAWHYRLSWGVIAGSVQVARDFFAPLRRPLPFLLCDLIAITAGTLIAPALDRIGDPVGAYPIIYAAFLAGLFLRRFDPSYVAGLETYSTRWFSFPVLLFTSGIVLALIAGVIAVRHVHVAVALGVPMVATIAVYSSLLKTKPRADQTAPRHNWWLELLCGLTLMPMMALHEQWAFAFFEHTSRDLSVLALPMLPPVVGLVYLPIRIHYFIDDPNNRSNGLWFAFTVTALTVKAVFG